MHLNLEVAIRRERNTLGLADRYTHVDSDKMVNQNRIIEDAKAPNAQERLQYRFTMKAAAASMIAANPDMAATHNVTGALQGARIVIDAGHDPFHDSKFPGFPAYNWSKTNENPRGVSEYDLNKASSAILGNIVEYAGGVPIHVNQDELYNKGNMAAQGMPGLAREMESHKADIMVSNCRFA